MIGLKKLLQNMKHLLNLNKYIFLVLLCLSCDDSTLNYIDCSEYGLFEDDCGQCVECNETCDCDLETCDYNANKDDCGVCFGDNSSCTGCMNEIASNYNQDAIIECSDCCVFGSIFIVFSNNNGNSEFQPTVHQTSTEIPIYWLNNSNQNIIIETVDSPQPDCIQDFESIFSNSNCNSYLTNQECVTDNDGCLWNIPNGYNSNWDNFEIEVPSGTSIVSQNQYYFQGFNNPSTGYSYYYQYGETSNDRFYGYINIDE